MNTELERMMIDTESRFPNGGELERIRSYARGLGGRLAVMRRVREAEDAIAVEATARLAQQHPGYVKTVPDARRKMEHDLKLTLRYAAQAHVQQDMPFFRTQYASWIGELLKATCPREVLVAGQEALRGAIESQLESSDARELAPYIDAFIEELRA